jgi:hypothetical protein
VIGLVVVAVLLAALAIGYLAYISSQPGATESEPPPTEGELVQARVDLYRVERSVDAALGKHEARLAAERTKQAIADELRGWQ